MRKEFIAEDCGKVVCDFIEVDLNGAENALELLAKYTDGNIIFAQKTRRVHARPVLLGETVLTAPLATIGERVCKISETSQIVTMDHVTRGDMVVTNPDGEEYIVKGSKFAKIYTHIGNGVYLPQGEVKPFVTTIADICFKASWGELQFAPKGSKLCVADMNDIYSVTDIAFESTYERVQNVHANENE